MILASLLIAQVALPGTSSVSVFFQDPQVCRGCHGMYDPSASAYDTWAGSPMAHAARNPLYLSALLEAEKDVPGVGDFCLRCHAPAAWMEGRCVPTDGSGLFDTDGGVTCSACHRMERSPWQRNGQYTVADDITMRGPITDPMAPHRAAHSGWFDRSELCGSCHDLRNPLVDRVDPEDGSPMNMPFPEQTTYTEWATSAYATEGETCQDCHMPEGEGRVAEKGPVRPDRSSHAFAGGNAFLLGAIAFLEPGLGLATELARGQARVDAMLQSAAHLELVDPPMLRRGEVAELTFRITNLTGHKLPTGYPEGRRIWLEVRSSRLRISLGSFDPVAGEPVDPAAHYRSVQGKFGVGPGHRLAINDTIYFDNRIPARGMTLTTTTAPVGVTYPEVEPGILAHWDDVTVTATVPCNLPDDGASIDGLLWYQSVTKAYVDALVEENGAHPRAQILEVAFEEADPGPTEMMAVSVDLAVDPASSCDPTDAGFPDSGARDAGAPDAGASEDAGVTEPEPADEGCGCNTGRPARGVDGLAVFGLLCLGLRIVRARKVRRR